MLSKIIKSSFIVLVLILETSLLYAVTNPKVICLTSTNELLVRKKCKLGEVRFSNELLFQQVSQSVGGSAVGPQGPTGNKGQAGVAGQKGGKGNIDFSACRIISGYSTNYPVSANGALNISLSCDPSTEFVFDEDYRATALFPESEGTTAFAQGRVNSVFTIAGDTREYEVSIYYNRAKIVGMGYYQVEARAICCPR